MLIIPIENMPPESVDPQLMEDLYVVEGTDKMRLAPAFATGDGAHELVKEVCA